MSASKATRRLRSMPCKFIALMMPYRLDRFQPCRSAARTEPSGRSPRQSRGGRTRPAAAGGLNRLREGLDHPAIRPDDLSVDPAGVGADQERDDARDILNLAQP